MSIGITKNQFIVYNCLKNKAAYMTLDELSAATGIARSSVHRLLNKLADAGIVSVLRIHKFQYQISNGYKTTERYTLLEEARRFYA